MAIADSRSFASIHAATDHMQSTAPLSAAAVFMSLFSLAKSIN